MTARARKSDGALDRARRMQGQIERLAERRARQLSRAESAYTADIEALVGGEPEWLVSMVRRALSHECSALLPAFEQALKTLGLELRPEPTEPEPPAAVELVRWRCPKHGIVQLHPLQDGSMHVVEGSQTATGERMCLMQCERVIDAPTPPRRLLPDGQWWRCPVHGVFEAGPEFDATMGHRIPYGMCMIPAAPVPEPATHRMTGAERDTVDETAPVVDRTAPTVIDDLRYPEPGEPARMLPDGTIVAAVDALDDPYRVGLL